MTVTFNHWEHRGSLRTWWDEPKGPVGYKDAERAVCVFVVFVFCRHWSFVLFWLWIHAFERCPLTSNHKGLRHCRPGFHFCGTSFGVWCKGSQLNDSRSCLRSLAGCWSSWEVTLQVGRACFLPLFLNPWDGNRWFLCGGSVWGLFCGGCCAGRIRPLRVSGCQKFHCSHLRSCQQLH